MRNIEYTAYDNLPNWHPTDRSHAWSELMGDRIRFHANDKDEIGKHQFKIYRMDRSLTYERSPDTDVTLFEDHGDHDKLIGPMDSHDDPQFKEGTIFCLSSGVFTFGFWYSLKEGQKVTQELIDLTNRSFQQTFQKLLPEKEVYFSSMEYHNDVLIDGAKVVGTVLCSNNSGVFAHGMCTWDYDHDFFAKVLPESQLKRLARQHGEGKGITGIKNEVADTNYTRKDFFNDLFATIRDNVAKYESTQS